MDVLSPKESHRYLYLCVFCESTGCIASMCCITSCFKPCTYTLYINSSLSSTFCRCDSKTKKMGSISLHPNEHRTEHGMNFHTKTSKWFVLISYSFGFKCHHSFPGLPLSPWPIGGIWRGRNSLWENFFELPIFLHSHLIYAVFAATQQQSHEIIHFFFFLFVRVTKEHLACVTSSCVTQWRFSFSLGTLSVQRKNFKNPNSIINYMNMLRRLRIGFVGLLMDSSELYLQRQWFCFLCSAKYRPNCCCCCCTHPLPPHKGAQPIPKLRK